jgi:hypothetical protein
MMVVINVRTPEVVFTVLNKEPTYLVGSTYKDKAWHQASGKSIGSWDILWCVNLSQRRQKGQVAGLQLFIGPYDLLV